MACNIKLTSIAKVTALLLCLNSPMMAQIKKVNFQLKFNPQSSLYDCYLHIAEGNAFTKKERIQFNAQVSFVLPAEAEMNIIETHMPLKDNLNYGGNNAAKWYITNKIENPAALRGQRIVSVTPDLSPTGQYNELREGDMVKLFSFNVYPLPTCGEAVRLFNNATDPGSSSEGLRGGDFSNGFTIGGTAQKYSGNLPTDHPGLPYGDIESHKSALVGETVVLEAGDWKHAASYLWAGPTGFRFEGKDVIFTKVGTEKSGKYTLTVTSEMGCATSRSLNLNVEGAEDLEKATSEKGASSVETVVKSAALDYSARVYPNPASSFINVAVNASRGAVVKANIYAIDGRLVMSNVINQTMDANNIEKTIPLKLQAGVYSVKLNVNGVESDHRFICVE